MDTYSITIGDDEYEVEANSPEEAQAKARAAASNAAPPATGGLSGATGISEVPEFDRRPEAPETLPGVVPSALPVPSLSEMTEMLPGAGGTLGLLLTGGSPGGAVAGSAGGEVVRQALRKLMGYAPATGNIQQATGMDPSGLPAMATGIAAEGATGGVSEWLSKLAASRLSPALREKALDAFAGIFPDKGEAARLEMKEAIRPIANKLPAGTSGRIQKIAKTEADKASEAVGAIYNVDTPASFQPVVDELRALETGQVRRPAHIAVDIDPTTGQTTLRDVPVDIKNPKLHKAYRKRAEAMELAQGSGVTSGKPTTIRDLFEARKAADEMATAKAYEAGKRGKDYLPPVRALKAERTAIKKQLHDPNVWPEAEKAAVLDALHAGWRTVEKGTKNPASGFIGRWLFGRYLPGRVGTTAGVIASKPAFWRSVGSKGMRSLASALEAGDEAAASQLLNAAINDYEQAGTR